MLYYFTVSDINYLFAGLSIAISFLLIVVSAGAYRRSGMRILKPLIIIFSISLIASLVITLSLLGIVTFPLYETILLFMLLSTLIIYLYLIKGLGY